MKEELYKYEASIDDLNQNIASAKNGREESDERSKLLEELAAKETQRAKNLTELEVFKDMDPDLFEKKKKETKDARIAVNRWTDNIYTLQSYCSDKFMIPKQDFNTQFNIPEDMDYV